MACKGVQWLALAMLLSVGVALAQYEEALEGGEPVKSASYHKQQPFGIWSYDEGARYGYKGGSKPEGDGYGDDYGDGYGYGKTAQGCTNTCNCNPTPGVPEKCDCRTVGLGLVQCGTECVNPLFDNECCGMPTDRPEQLKNCEAPKICKNGDCVCPDGWLTCMDGNCYDPTSKDTCGTECGKFTACQDTEVCDSGKCRCPDNYVSCDGGTYCYPGKKCPECDPPKCADGAKPRDDDPNACGKTEKDCKVCRGKTPRCVEGKCVACVENPNGNNKGACKQNSDCCSCQCHVPEGQNDGQCKGDPKLNQGGDSCQTCNKCPFPEPDFTRLG